MPMVHAPASQYRRQPPARPQDSSSKMTTFKTLLLLALVSVATADTNTNSLDQMATMAQDVWSNFTSFWGIEVPSSEQVTQRLRDGAADVANKLTEIVRTMQTEMQAHSGQVSETMRAASANFNRTIEQLKSPENTRRVEELRTHISQGMRTLADEATRVKDAFTTDTAGVRSELSNAMNAAIEAGRRMSERVHTAVLEHQEQHGKQ